MDEDTNKQETIESIKAMIEQIRLDGGARCRLCGEWFGGEDLGRCWRAWGNTVKRYTVLENEWRKRRLRGSPVRVPIEVRRPQMPRTGASALTLESESREAR